MQIKSILQSQNSSVTLSNSDSDEASLEEQEPSTSDQEQAIDANQRNFNGNNNVGNNERKNIPWIRRKYSPDVRSLHDEVMDLYLWLKPTAEEIFLRRSVFNRISSILKLVYPDSNVSVFGSVATNLFLPTSDIDIVMEIKQFDVSCLHVVADKMQAFGNHYEEVKVIDRSYVPIIKLIDKATRFHIDISFNTHVAVLQTVNWVESTKRNVPQLEPLVLVLKQFLTQRDLNHPFNGGLSSYALILMTYSFIKSREVIIPPNIDNTSLGFLLYTFFWFYGYKFNYAQTAIRVRGKYPVFIPKEQLAHEMNEDPYTSILFIEDPVQTRNNVGKGAHNMMAIKSAFAEAYDLIFSGIMQCYVFDRTFIQTCYCGPMLSLVISFTEEEINYRILLRNEIICNNTKKNKPKDISPQQRVEPLLLEKNYTNADPRVVSVESVPKNSQLMVYDKIPTLAALTYKME